MTEKKSSDSPSRSTRAFQRRRSQVARGGSRWMQLIASERALSRSGFAIATETLVVTLAFLLLCWWFSPQDLLLVRSGFGWVWLLPVVFSLRYGLSYGVLSAFAFLGGYYLKPLSGVFPLTFFLGGFFLVMMTGQFGDAWGGRLRHMRTLTDYLNERLGVLTKSHFLLRLSHERLEQDLLSRPATLRDSLTQLRAIAMQPDPMAPARRGMLMLSQAERFLELAAQACQLESARVYAWHAGQPLTNAVASVGAPFDLDPDDLLLTYALENKTLAHVQSVDLGGGLSTRYVAVVPLLDAYEQVIGLLVVAHMPFLALNRDNLQFLLVLCGFYADGVRQGAVAGLILHAYPQCPQEFALDFSRLVRLQRKASIASSLVALVFDQSDIGQTLFEHVQHSRRALDVQWPIHGPEMNAILVLMPLSGESAVDGFLLRVEDSMRAQFGVDFESGRVAVHSMPLPSGEPAEALAAFFRRCLIHV